MLEIFLKLIKFHIKSNEVIIQIVLSAFIKIKNGEIL